MCEFDVHVQHERNDRTLAKPAGNARPVVRSGGNELRGKRASE
jgi:hypothetical protein